MTLWDAMEPEGPDSDGDPGTVTWSVAELGEAISASLRAAFPTQVWVTGEIRSIRPPGRTGHQYFDLIEPGAEPGAYPDAKISVCLFRRARSQVMESLAGTPGSAALADGVEVRIRCRVDWWTGGGQLRLIMSDIDPVFTLGQLDAQRRALLTRLAADGLLEANAALEVPPVPLRIGLVTSAGSAAHADFVHELETSRYLFDVLLADARVQGAEATRTLVSAIDRLTDAGVDLIVVIRGGGSRTDLVAFDHADVAYAIARSPLPVFTGIGHEIDRSVADEVAHSAFKTPTAVAQHLIGRVAAAETALADQADRLMRIAGHHLDRVTAGLDDRLRRVAHAAQVADTRAATHLNALQHHLQVSARRRLHDATRENDRRGRRLAVAAPRHLTRAGERLDNARARIDAADPARILARGWSLTHTPDGVLVRSVTDIAPGTELETTLADGVVHSTVRQTTQKENEP